MQPYNVYQKVSKYVYRLKEDKRVTEFSTFNPITLLPNILGDDGSIWAVEKVYSASDNTGSGNVHTSDGYAGAIYRNSATNEIIMVNAGTSNGLDYVNDAQMAIGLVPTQYASARQMMQDAITLSGGNTSKISVAGHSLGGSIAQLLAIEFGVPAVTFNAYGVGEIMNVDSISTTGAIVETAEFLINKENYPDLFVAYHSGINESQIINYKMSGDVIGNAGKDVGITAIVGGEGNILTTVIGTVTLTMSDIILLRDPLAVMNLGHLLSQHGITEFANYNPMKFDFDSLMQGGGIRQSIIPNFTPTQYDPIILDLDGDGIETVGLNAGILFDHNGDGVKTGTGWVGKDDGLLVRDINNNGTIDTGRELFGDNTILNNGQKAKDGFAAISDLDVNQDGNLNSSDAVFSSLRVWQDINQDGVSQSGELKTLSALGISSINTRASITGGQNQNNGNVIIGSSSFMQSDGTIKTSGALNFTGNTFTREFSDVIDTSAVAGLPDMRASGTVRDLREAAALSSDLATKLQTYAESNTRNSVDLDALLNSWASTSDMQTLASTLKPGFHPVGGRGTNLNQDEINKLNILEKFTGLYGAISNFSDPMDIHDGVVNRRYSETLYGINLNADMINKSYALLSKSVDSAISVQTDLKEAMNDVMFKFSADGVTLDMSNLYAKVSGDNASNIIGDVINLYTYFKDNAGELFSATAQLDTFNWIKDQLIEGHASISDYVSSNNVLLRSNVNDIIDINSNVFNIVTTSGGNDKITIHGNGQNIVVATGGNMDIQFTDWEDDGVAELNEGYIQTGAGNDIIKTSIGSDTIRAGAGNDVITDVGGNNLIYGEDGNDTISINASSERIESNSQINQNIIYGGAGNDSISGAKYEMNFLYGGDGNDFIGAGVSDEVLDGGSGNDFISAGWGGNKTYVFNKNSGHDVVLSSFSGNDVAQFTGGINASDLSFKRKNGDSSFMAGNDDWIMTIGNSENVVELWASPWVYDKNSNIPSLIEIFEFDDGVKLDVTELFRQNNFAVSGSINSETIIMSQIITNKIAALEGDDVIIDDTAKNTTYVFGLGGGKDVIEESGGTDTIAFGSGITTASLNFTQNGSDLVIRFVNNVNDQITILNWYSDQSQRIEKFIIGEESLDANKFIDFKLNTANVLDIEHTLLGNNEADSLIGNEINHKFIGGRGNDFLQGSFGVDKYIYNRGDGEDVISDFGGNDGIVFGAGINQNDLSLRKNGNDFIVVIAGDDLGSITFKDWYQDDRVNGYIEQFQLADGSILNLKELPVADSGANNDGSIWGWNGQDLLIGGNDNDSIIAYAGNDVLYGNNGNDILDAGFGDDILYGGGGNDSLLGGVGNDILYGNDGNDLIRDYVGSNKLYGGAGDDILSGALIDNITSNSDIQATNFFSGGTGNDILNGYGDSDVFSYDVGDGNDVIANFSDSNENTIAFGNGISKKDIDYVIDDNGILLKIGGQGSGSIAINGWGIDAGYYSLFGNLTFMDGSSVSLPEIFHNSTYLSQGTSSNDYIMGQERNNIIIGDRGNDQFYGAKYNDTYVFNRGDGKDEIVNDQGGNDTLQFNGVLADDLYTYDSGRDLIIGYGGDRSDEVKIGWYYSNTPFIQIERISIDGELYSVNNLVQSRQLTNYLSGSDGDDVIQGTEFKDSIYGFDGNDIIYGGISSDSLGGGGGDDLLSGEKGNDSLWGGTGNDLLNGGLGNDHYQFAIGDGADIIEDSGGNDSIEFAIGVKQEDLEFNQVENDLILRNNKTADQVTIKNWMVSADNQIEHLVLNETSLSLVQLVDDFNRVKTGTNGDDNLILNKKVAEVNAKAGNDTIVDQTLNNTNYIFNLGDGQDSIRDSGSVADKISFGAGINLEQLQFVQSGGDLIVTLNSQDQITIKDYALHDNRIESLSFADGGQVNLADILYQRGVLTDAVNLKLSNNSDTVWSSHGGSYTLRDGDNQLIISNSGQSNNISAGIGNDSVLIVGDSDNKLSLGAGNNQVSLQNGNNTITTGAGNDTVFAPNGNNVIRAGDGDNLITLGIGTQNIVTGNGNDTIKLSAGNIALNSGAGDDLVTILDLQELQQASINLGDGDDQLNVTGHNGLAKVTASLGNDKINLTGVNTQISDSGGDNVINIDNHELMTNATNTLRLGANEDIVNLTSDGTSSISLGNGNNQLNLVGNGINSITAGVDNDSINIVGGVSNKLSLGAGYNQVDVRGSMSNAITTGLGNDIINVQSGDNIIRAGDGENVIRVVSLGTQNIVTGAGNDSIELNSGNIILNSGAGNDNIVLNQSSTSSNNSINLGDGDDFIEINAAGGSSTINGSTGNDQFIIHNNSVKLNDGGGNNIIHLDNSAISDDINTINLGLGDDQVTVISNGKTTIKTSNGDNVLNLSGTGSFNVTAGTGLDNIDSGAGNDILNSGAGNDTINGNAGDDRLIAGAGNDTLSGGIGDDVLEGGTDDDSYYFNAGDGQDVIKDSGGIDQVVFGDGVLKDDLWFMRSGKDLVVNNTKTQDEVKVTNWFGSKNNQLESFSLASGEVLSGQAVASLVQAMASFNPQPMAEMAMNSAQQSQYQDILKNTWVDPTK